MPGRERCAHNSKQKWNSSPQPLSLSGITNRTTQTIHTPLYALRDKQTLHTRTQANTHMYTLTYIIKQKNNS